MYKTYFTRVAYNSELLKILKNKHIKEQTIYFEQKILLAIVGKSEKKKNNENQNTAIVLHENIKNTLRG